MVRAVRTIANLDAKISGGVLSLRWARSPLPFAKLRVNRKGRCTSQIAYGLVHSEAKN
jgi:hypothetical protein